jgi:hypothetical protein
VRELPVTRTHTESHELTRVPDLRQHEPVSADHITPARSGDLLRPRRARLAREAPRTQDKRGCPRGGENMPARSPATSGRNRRLRRHVQVTAVCWGTSSSTVRNWQCPQPSHTACGGVGVRSRPPVSKLPLVRAVLGDLSAAVTAQVPQRARRRMVQVAPRLSHGRPEQRPQPDDCAVDPVSCPIPASNRTGTLPRHLLDGTSVLFRAGDCQAASKRPVGRNSRERRPRRTAGRSHDRLVSHGLTSGHDRVIVSPILCIS